MTKGLKKQIESEGLQITLKENEPMSLHTSFKIGGPCDLLAIPKDSGSAVRVLYLAAQAGVPILVIGNGSNLLVSDRGIRGLVLKTVGGLSQISVDTQGSITADAGVLLSALSQRACGASMTGLEFAFGIPGSVGGAVYMNAGAYDADMSRVVIKTLCANSGGETVTISGEAHEFAYRHSAFMNRKDLLILSTTVRLSKGNEKEIAEKMKKTWEKRKGAQPLNLPSAGSVFRRPQGYFAGSLIEQAGLKGFSVGGAGVSEKHAGFIVNNGCATCADVLALIAHIQNEVKNRFGVDLVCEIQKAGEF